MACAPFRIHCVVKLRAISFLQKINHHHLGAFLFIWKALPAIRNTPDDTEYKRH